MGSSKSKSPFLQCFPSIEAAKSFQHYEGFLPFSISVCALYIQVQMRCPMLPCNGVLKGWSPACRRYNRQGVDVQLDTVQALRGVEYKYLLPGHGRPGTFKSSDDRNQHIDHLFAEEHYVPA